MTTKISSNRQLSIDANLDLTNFRIVNLSNPVNPLDGVNRQYVHALPSGHLGNSTDYVEVTNSGNVVLHGAATVWDDIRVEPSVRSAPNAPTFEQWADDAGLGDTGVTNGVYLYSFTDVVAALEKEIHFTMQMPHGWAGTPIELHAHWIGNLNDTTAAPRWGLEYAWQNIGTTFSGTVTTYSDGVNYVAGGTDPNITAGKHYISKIATINPGTHANGISSILIGRLFRNSSSTSDTYDVATNKCGLLYIDAHYEINTIGSNTEYTK